MNGSQIDELRHHGTYSSRIGPSVLTEIRRAGLAEAEKDAAALLRDKPADPKPKLDEEKLPSFQDFFRVRTCKRPAAQTSSTTP